MSDTKSCGDVKAFVIGAVVGAAIALLYAPRSGEKTRQLLAQKVEDLRDKAGKLIDDAKEVVREKLGTLVEAGEEIEDKVSKKVKAA